MFNSLQYRKGECSHDEYYSQFVTPSIIELVKRRIGKARIKQSIDPYFNDIPLKEWDDLVIIIRQMVPSNWRELNSASYRPEDQGKFIWSTSDGVCIAKQAARIIKESN